MYGGRTFTVETGHKPLVSFIQKEVDEIRSSETHEHAPVGLYVHFGVQTGQGDGDSKHTE